MANGAIDNRWKDEVTTFSTSKNSSYIGTVHVSIARRRTGVKSFVLNFNITAEIPYQTVIFTLPEIYRPLVGFPVTLYQDGRPSAASLWVNTNGEISTQAVVPAKNYSTAQGCYI